MKKIIFVGILSLVLVVFLSGCLLNFQTKQKTNDKLKVAVTIFPIYDIVREIAGDKIEVSLVLPPGASPHTFEVSTSQIKNLQGIKTLFVVGQGLDNWSQNIISSVPDSQIFDLSKTITLKPFDIQDSNHTPDPDEEGSGQYDPHYWLDPTNAISVAKVVSKQLAVLSPENEVYFNQRAEDFINNLLARDIVWKEKLSGLENNKLVVFHDAWGYFADYYGLDIVASFEPFPGQEPTPQYLKELQIAVKDYNIKTLFAEPQLSQDSIKTFARDLGVDIKVLDPNGGVEGRNSYIEMMEFNVENVYELLK
ncbi:MAG: hypothetical protein COY69_01010 [Candidatus Magasanikbacteria bacterium CG_4_10_14_0_8_um_filter_32_14]|uniref:Zinc ABC transporter substrate-binding protein n=2 Tax=Candidatus Magasanikiibacteriota TaxID=1752731 RepID=A0A2M7R9Y8_9BACT|nr:MAG: hypothetical protein AUJ23_02365 [Candidatus Magasanikbacteria bacterium CG1_02_32_51]PIY93560.1 MAG: hypothetical protein COY69_01010 [Candidatus Magasanikbacteria bacterium CG_4_10_14_0_8_um_filter_32_14]